MSTYTSTSTSLAVLSPADAEIYLARLQLPSTLLKSGPSLATLRKLQLHSLIHIPFESSGLHLPPDFATLDWSTPVLPRQGANHAFALGQPAFDRIMGSSKRGHLCFGQTGIFAALLRTLGFRCSEIIARMSSTMGKDPSEVGYAWAGTTHAILVVDWDGSDRYLVDIGYGGAQCPFPIKLVHGERGDASRSPTTGWKLEYGPLPHADLVGCLPDSVPHWTYYRWSPAASSANGDIAEAIAEDTTTKKGYWSPLCAFMLQSATPTDLVVANWYATTNPEATFANFFLVTKEMEEGPSKTLAYRWDRPDYDGMAKLIVGEEVVEKVEMKVGPLRDVLEREFGFSF